MLQPDTSDDDIVEALIFMADHDMGIPMGRPKQWTNCVNLKKVNAYYLYVKITTLAKKCDTNVIAECSNSALIGTELHLSHLQLHHMRSLLGARWITMGGYYFDQGQNTRLMRIVKEHHTSSSSMSKAIVRSAVGKVRSGEFAHLTADVTAIVHHIVTSRILATVRRRNTDDSPEAIAERNFRTAFAAYTGIDVYDTSMPEDETHKIEALALQYKFATAMSSPITLDRPVHDFRAIQIASAMRLVAQEKIEMLHPSLQQRIAARVLELPEVPMMAADRRFLKKQARAAKKVQAEVQDTDEVCRRRNESEWDLARMREAHDAREAEAARRRRDADNTRRTTRRSAKKVHRHATTPAPWPAGQVLNHVDTAHIKAMRDIEKEAALERVRAHEDEKRKAREREIASVMARADAMRIGDAILFE